MQEHARDYFTKSYEGRGCPGHTVSGARSAKRPRSLQGGLSGWAGGPQPAINFSIQRSRVLQAMTVYQIGLRFAFATFYNDWVQFRRKYHRNITETKGDDMLFMAIFSYSPEDRNLVIERGLGAEKSAGINVIGEWFDISGHRVFRLFEAEDDTHLASSVFGWSDLGVAEVIPVMETEKALKLLKKSGKKC